MDHPHRSDCGEFPKHPLVRWTSLFGLVIAAGLATRPYVEMGFNDDWDYTHLALTFAARHHIVYSGWATAAVLVQVVYAALLTKLFGGAYTVHRLGTLFISGFLPIVTYKTGRALKLRGEYAYFAALALGLSPYFIPHEVSFMSDVYGCAFTLAAMHAGIRAVRASTGARALVWYAVSLAWAFAGGANRQVVWVIGPAVFVGYFLAWRVRDRASLAAGVLLTAVYIAGCWMIMAWLKRQPGFLFEAPSASTLRDFSAQIVNVVRLYSALLLTLLALAIPVLVAGVRLRRRAPVLAAVIVGIAVYAVCAWKVRMAFPYLFNVLSNYGLLTPGTTLPGSMPVVLPNWICRLITAAACGLTTLLLASWLPHARRSVTRAARALWQSAGEDTRDAAAGTIPWVYTALYAGALIVRASRGEMYDRYALPLAPVLIFGILRMWQTAGRPRPNAAGYLLLAVFAAFGIAVTHDHFELSRQRVAALEALRSLGIERQRIEAGFEADMSYQEEARGSIYRGEPGGPPVQDAPLPTDGSPRIWYSPMTPAITPAYYMATSPLPHMNDCAVPRFDYRTWLPPTERRLYVVCAEAKQ